MKGARTPAQPGPAGPGPWYRLCVTARRDGWPAALGALQTEAGPGVLVLGPRGHAVATAELAAGADRVRAGEATGPRTRAAETVRELPVPGLVTVRTEAGDGGTAEWEPGPVQESWATALAGVRLGLSYGLLDAALDHLGGRTTGDSPLLQHQLVKGTVADAVVRQTEIRCALDAAGPGALDWRTATDVHAWTTGVDRALLRLFGASGYLEGGPGRTAHVSELLADAYVGPDDRELPRARP